MKRERDFDDDENIHSKIQVLEYGGIREFAKTFDLSKPYSFYEFFDENNPKENWIRIYIDTTIHPQDNRRLGTTLFLRLRGNEPLPPGVILAYHGNFEHLDCIGVQHQFLKGGIYEHLDNDDWTWRYYPQRLAYSEYFTVLNEFGRFLDMTTYPEIYDFKVYIRKPSYLNDAGRITSLPFIYNHNVHLPYMNMIREDYICLLDAAERIT